MLQQFLRTAPHLTNSLHDIP